MKTAKTKIMRTAFGTLIFALLASTCTAFEIFALTNNDTDDVALSASFGNAVWQGKDPNGGDWEIYLYSKDTDEIQKITDNDTNDINPVIAGPYVAWEVTWRITWRGCRTTTRAAVRSSRRCRRMR